MFQSPQGPIALACSFDYPEISNWISDFSRLRAKTEDGDSVVSAEGAFRKRKCPDANEILVMVPELRWEATPAPAKIFFTCSNLKVDDDHSFFVGGFQVSFTRLADYERIWARLDLTGGTDWTGEFTIVGPSSVDEVFAAADTLVDALSIVQGSRTNWTRAEFADERENRCLLRLCNRPVKRHTGIHSAFFPEGFGLKYLPGVYSRCRELQAKIKPALDPQKEAMTIRGLVNLWLDAVADSDRTQSRAVKGVVAIEALCTAFLGERSKLSLRTN